jgi:hypothetical protein
VAAFHEDSVMQAQSPSTPPAPPAPPAAPGQLVVGGTPATPADVYQGLRAQRRELGRQLESLEEKRSELSSRLEEPTVTGADRKGLEQRITDIDGRISSVDQQIAVADAQLARAAAEPGAAVDPTPPRRPGPPEEAFVLGGLFMLVVFLPLSIAYARRVWRRGASAVASLPRELGERLQRLEQAVDAVAVEVERIGEGQRFVTRLLGERDAGRVLGSPAAQPLPVEAREAAEARVRR